MLPENVQSDNVEDLRYYTDAKVISEHVRLEPRLSPHRHRQRGNVQCQGAHRLIKKHISDFPSSPVSRTALRSQALELLRDVVEPT